MPTVGLSRPVGAAEDRHGLVAGLQRLLVSPQLGQRQRRVPQRQRDVGVVGPQGALLEVDGLLETPERAVVTILLLVQQADVVGQPALQQLVPAQASQQRARQPRPAPRLADLSLKAEVPHQPHRHLGGQLVVARASAAVRASS